MELEKFKDANRNELSMIEVAHAILNEHGKEMVFADLVNEIQTFLGKSDQEIRERLPQFYMDLNFDGSFISLGENTWGLRSWYPYESIDEALVHTDDEDDEDRPRKKSKKVNAFLDDAADDDDVIDYNDDDPEDNDLDDDYDDEDDEDFERIKVRTSGKYDLVLVKEDKDGQQLNSTATFEVITNGQKEEKQ